MGEPLSEVFRNAQKFHKSGNVTLVCIDDENGLGEDKYGSMGKNTIVPRSTKDGGISGKATAEERRYGDGFKRRQVGADANGAFMVMHEEDNFKPDLFGKDAQDAASGIPEDLGDVMFNTPAPGTMPKTAQQASGTVDPMQMMMQMMNMFMQNAQPQMRPQAPAVQPAPEPAPVTKNGVRVTFSGAFGRMTTTYASAFAQERFIVLASSKNQDSMYEPPISHEMPLSVEFDGNAHSVLNLGLSFTYKGDILLIMPFCAEPIGDIS